jgi:hypothetical protein
MSNYTKSTNFATKDNLTPGDPLKVVRGTEIDTEFNNIATAVATKTDNASAAITGGAIDGATVGATTPATGSFTTLAASGTTTLAGALVGAVTQAAFNTVSTTLNLGGAATAVNLGAATGTATVNNTTLAAKAITASTTLAVTGTSTLTGAVTATAGVTGPITSSSVSITGGSITGITDLAVADGGTGASTAAGGLNNLLPSQTGNSSKYLQTDGTNASWDAVSLSTADITGTLGVANGGTGVTTSTGTTNVVLSNSPTLVTPTLGVATATSLQGIIGNVTPAAGNFTTLGASSTATLNTLASSGATLTGGTINGMTIGATTASTGAFTTLTTSSTVTHNGGTANGVTYLNGSKVLTSGSVLSFDGTKLQLTGTAATNTTSIGLGGSTTGYQRMLINNTSGGGQFGVEGSTASTITTGSAAYSTVVGDYAGYPLHLITGNVVRATLDTSGNLGLGVTPSASNLVTMQSEYGIISGNSGINIAQNAYYNSGWKYTATAVATRYAQSAGIHYWYNAPSGTLNTAITFTQAMTLDASGNLLVGTTSQISAGKLCLLIDPSNNSGLAMKPTADNYDAIRFLNASSSQVGGVSCTSSATSYNTSSDYRLKNTIAPMTGALAKVALLKPCTYKWNADGSDGEGFIAHELAEVVPQAVTGEKDALDEEGNPKYQGIDTSFLVATLTAAIQELKAEFDAYKASHP